MSELDSDKANMTATGIGCGVTLILGTLFGCAGAWIGFALMPALPPGSTFEEALGASLLWGAPGFVIGFLSAAFVGGRIARWFDKKIER